MCRMAYAHALSAIKRCAHYFYSLAFREIKAASHETDFKPHAPFQILCTPSTISYLAGRWQAVRHLRDQP